MASERSTTIKISPNSSINGFRNKPTRYSGTAAMVLALTNAHRWSTNQQRCFWYHSCPPTLGLHRSPFHSDAPILLVSHCAMLPCVAAITSSLHFLADAYNEYESYFNCIKLILKKSFEPVESSNSIARFNLRCEGVRKLVNK